MRKPLTLLSVLLLYCLLGYSQGNILVDTSGVPNISNPLVICGGNKTISFQVSNITTSSISNIVVTYDLPTGMSYSTGSLSGTGVTVNSSNTNKPIFTISSLASGNLNLFSFSVSADCNIMSIISNVDSLKANIAITYKKGSTTFAENHKSTSITVYEPNITLTVSNNSATANVGDTVSRTISIVNGGSGSLSSLEFYVVNGSDLSIASLNNGTYTTNGDTAFISLSSSDIMKFGDGDASFEQNEKITISEKVIVNGCVNLQSTYDAYWGCNNEPCQEVNAYASVSVTGSTPNFSYVATSSQSGCYDSSIPNAQQIRIVNTGTGPASDISIEVYQAKSSAYAMQNTFYSYIDDASFTYQYGANGSAVSAVVDSTVLNTPYSCFNTTAPKAYVRITIPALDKGDTLYINWNVYTCCVSLDSTTSSFNADKEINGWNYEVAYSNQCGTNTFASGVKSGRTSNKTKMVTQITSNPADMNEGDTASFQFSTSSFVLLPGETNLWYFKFEFIIPACVKAVGNSVTFVDKTGNIWVADSIVTHDSIVDAYFGSAQMKKFKISNTTTTSIDIMMDCASCTQNGAKDVVMNTYYIPSPSCGCESELGTVTATVNTHCAVTCDSGGVWTYSYDIQRSSFGLPDNDNNGQPDNNGIINMDSINLHTAMYHDTLSAYFKAVIVTTSGNPNWKYLYAESAFTEQDAVALDASLKIYDASANVYYTCNSISYSLSDSTYKYYLSIDSLAKNGVLPTNFVFENGDSIWFTPRYVIENNPGNDIYTTTVYNHFYASNIALPDTNEARYSCDNYNGYFNVAGFVMANFGPSEYVTGACDSTTIDQQFRMSIGPCCTNFAGGNLFPYEYRVWSYVNYVKLILPSGYNFASASYTFSQTAGTGKTLSTVVSMTPDAFSGDTVYFNIEKYYQEFGGTSFIMGDDGYIGTMSCKIVPTCGIAPNIVDTIKWLNGFSAPNNYIKGYTEPYVYFSDPFNVLNTQDNITSTVPDLNISPSLAIIQGTDLTASWNFSLQNNSIYSDASHVWVAFKSQSGNINIKYVVNTATNDTIYPVGDIFQLGTMAIASLTNLNIVCTYTTCDDDSIEAYTGWNCSGYPANLASSSCFSQSMMLYLDPQPSKIDLEITQSPTNIDLCDTATYEVKVSSIQLGALQNITVTAQIPYGIHLYSNSSELQNPKSNSFVSIGDPDSIGNGLYQWNIDANSLVIDSLGLTGISDTTKNYFKLKFDATTNCDFVSGFVVDFTAKGEFACGALTTSKSLSSLPLEIKGAPQKQFTTVHFALDNSTLCDTTVKCHVSVVNLGPSTDLSSNHYVFEMPSTYDYVAGSFISILNANTIGLPTIDTLNGKIIIDWIMPSYVLAGDSVVFDFDIKENATFICGTYTLDMFTAQSGNVLCVATGDSCTVYFLSSSAIGTISKEKMELDLSSFSSTVKNISATQDDLYLNVSVKNIGTSASTDTIYLNIYYDTDANGVYSTGDYFLGYTTTLATIAANATYNYLDTLSVTPGYSCMLIAVINTSGPNLSCSCLSDEMAYETPAPIIAPLTDINICSGINTLIGAQAINNVNYNWSPSIGLSDSTIAQPFVFINNTSAIAETLNYILTASNALGGCKVSDTMSVIVNPVVDASIVASTNAVCKGDTVIFTYTGTSNSNMTFNWNFGNGSIVSGSNVGPYSIVFPNGSDWVTLSVSSGICSATDSIAITSGTIANIFASTDTAVCSNIPLVLNAGNGYDNYVWSTGDTTSNLLVKVGGTYWITINNGNCMAQDTINVSILDLPNKAFESGDSLVTCDTYVVLGPLANMYTYVWSTGSTNDTTIVHNSGTYSVMINNGKCQIEDSIYVDFSQIVKEPFTLKDSTVCTDKAIQLSAGSGYSNYLWSTGATTSSIMVATSGTYWVQINNKNCNYTDSIQINLLALPYSGLQPDSMHSCNNEYSLAVTPGYSNLWSTGETADTITVASSGYYWVKLNDGKCSTTDSFYVDFSSVINEPFADLPANMQICVESPIEVGGSYVGNYLWSTGETSQNITIKKEGTYWVEVSNKDCKSSDTITVENISEENFKIGNVFTPNNDGFNELFYAHLDNIDQFHITIWNRWGKQIFESSSKDYSWNGEVNGKKPEQGTYFWSLTYSTLCAPDKQNTQTGFVELLLDSK